MVAAAILRRHTAAHSAECSLFFLRQRLVTAEPSFQDIFARQPERVGVIPELSQSQVAVVAEQSSQLAGRMAVVECETLPPIVPTAKVAEGRPSEYLRLLQGQAVAPHRFADVLALAVVAIVGSVRRAPLIAMLRAVLSHASVGALSARRLPPSSCDVVKAVTGLQVRAHHFSKSGFRPG
jgi:hypothetical protein